MGEYCGAFSKDISIFIFPPLHLILLDGALFWSMSSHGFKRRCLIHTCLVDCSSLDRCMSPVVMKEVSGLLYFYF